MQMRVAAYAVITDDQGRVLLAHWVEGRYNAWTMPGGGLEPGEDPALAVVREVFEETGFDVEIDELLGIDSRVIPAAQRLGSDPVPLHTLRVLYRAHITGGFLRNETDGSTDRADWFTLDEVRALPRVKLVEVALDMAGIPL